MEREQHATEIESRRHIYQRHGHERSDGDVSLEDMGTVEERLQRAALLLIAG
ncbi:MAG: hypothetical protein OSA81_10895 [Longimicrobiales bacterium]|nr:hypothetical protein [Longimicrobiales bacterium]